MVTSKNTIQEQQQSIGEYLSAIFDHFGAPRQDRYDGEFSYPDCDTGAVKLVEYFAFGYKEIRDTLAEALSRSKSAPDAHHFKNVHIETEDVDLLGHWLYKLHIIVTGEDISSTQEAYSEMGAFLQAAAQRFPAPYKGIPWRQYCESYQVDDEMLWRDGAQHQLEMLGMISKLSHGIQMHVVGEHTSKSIRLPVVQVELPRNATRVTIRDNFHDVCISVDSQFPIQDTLSFSSIFNTKNKGGFFEGFPKGLVHGSYEENSQKFSLAVDGYPELMIIMGELIRQDVRTKFRPAPNSAALKI